MISYNFKYVKCFSEIKYDKINYMKNQEIAKIFFQIADFMKMEGIAFKPQAYIKVALNLENFNEDVGEIYKRDGLVGLQKIPGVGKNLAEAIEEYLKKGKIKTLEDFKKKSPIKLDELLNVESLGPKKIKVLYEKLGIKNLKDLEKQANKHRIALLDGFGKKAEQNILQGLKFLKTSVGRQSLGIILPIAREVVEKLKTLSEVKQISLAGSLRRRKETIGDADILVVSDKPDKIMDYFVELDGVEKVWAKGGTKASVRMKMGFDMDLRIVKEESFGSALQYFTGSKEHNIATRRIAIDKGLKLSEYGLFKHDKQIAGKTEKDVYNALGLTFIEPELREDDDKILQLALLAQNKLPKLVELKDIKGDLHCHSNWDGGKHSIEEMVDFAIKIGYEYIGISDHTKFLKIESGLDKKQLLAQKLEIEKLNNSLKIENCKLKILHGCECNIMNDGSLDIKDEVLEKLDYVIAGLHSSLKMSKKEMTERLIKAMKNPNVDIISHPTTRLLGKREEAQLDFDKILKIAHETGTILEINSSPERLDLNDFYIRRAKSEGVKMIINTDSHQKEQLNLMEYGVSQARRGWVEKQDIINTNSIEDLLKYFKK
jgi:DNA polymerase (family 10)